MSIDLNFSNFSITNTENGFFSNRVDVIVKSGRGEERTFKSVKEYGSLIGKIMNVLGFAVAFKDQNKNTHYLNITSLDKRLDPDVRNKVQLKNTVKYIKSVHHYVGPLKLKEAVHQSMIITQIVEPTMKFDKSGRPIDELGRVIQELGSKEDSFGSDSDSDE